MLKHLRVVHKIEPKDDNSSNPLLAFGFTPTASNSESAPSSRKQDKEKIPVKKILVEKLTRFYLNDPSISMASLTSDEMLSFLKNVQKIKDPIRTLPVRQTISNNISKIYDDAESLIIQFLKISPKVIAVILDLWSDDGVKLSYLNISISYSLNFEIETISLAILPSYEQKTMENLKADIIYILRKFGLCDKCLVFVSDQGANIKAAIRLVIEELGKGFSLHCILHSIHNLIYADVLKNNKELKTLV